MGSQAGAKSFRELFAHARSVMELLSELFGVKSTALLHRAALADSALESSAPDNTKTFTFQSDEQTSGESPRTPSLSHALPAVSSPRTPSSVKPQKGFVESTKVIDEMLALLTVETVHYGARYTRLAAAGSLVYHNVHRFSRPLLVPFTLMCDCCGAQRWWLAQRVSTGMYLHGTARGYGACPMNCTGRVHMWLSFQLHVLNRVESGRVCVIQT